MPKKLYYTEGPKIMGCGIAGKFKITEPKEVPDDLAEILLRKGRHREYPEPTPATASKGAKKKED